MHITGTDVTITGAGFGSDSAALDVLVGGVPCAVSSMHLDGVVSTLTCRVAYRPPGAEGVAPMAAGRGARWLTLTPTLTLTLTLTLTRTLTLTLTLTPTLTPP